MTDDSQESLMDWTDLELEEDDKFWAGEEGRARLRKIYKRIIGHIDNNEAELKNIESKNLLLFMQKADTMYPKVRVAQETALDARMVRRLARLIRQQAEEMSANITQFRPEEYTLRLMNRMTGDGAMTRKKWAVFGARVKVFFCRSPCLSYMYGALDTTPPSLVCRKRREAQSKTRTRDLVETKDTVLKKLETTGTRTEELVRLVFRCLVTKFRESSGRPVSFFRFVLDPRSFSASVENLFHVSFLVKEGKVIIAVDQKVGLPVISPLTIQEENQLEGSKQQVVIRFSVEDWEMMVARLDIKEPMIA